MEGEKKREGRNSLPDQSGITRGWVLQGGWCWGLRNMTDFLVKNPKWKSRKCCLMLTNILVTAYFCATRTQTPWVSFLSLSHPLFSLPHSLSPTDTPTHRNFESHTSQAPTLGECVQTKKTSGFPLSVKARQMSACVWVCVCVWPQGREKKNRSLYGRQKYNDRCVFVCVCGHRGDGLTWLSCWTV